MTRMAPEVTRSEWNKSYIREGCRVELNLKFQPETSASSLRPERPPPLSRTYCLRSQSTFTMPGNPQPLTFINFPTYRQKLLHDIQKTHSVMSFDPVKLELVPHYWYVTIPLHYFCFKLFLQARQWAEARATISIASIPQHSSVSRTRMLMSINGIAQ